MKVLFSEAICSEKSKLGVPMTIIIYYCYLGAINSTFYSFHDKLLIMNLVVKMKIPLAWKNELQFIYSQFRLSQNKTNTTWLTILLLITNIIFL